MQKLSFIEKINYGVGGLYNLSFSMISTYLLVYYTDAIHMAPLFAGLVLTVSRAFDAVTDLSVGYLVDKYKHKKFGRTGLWLILSPIAIIVTIYLSFTIPVELSQTSKFVYALVTFSLLTLALTMAGIPYGSRATLITDNPKERDQISTIRMVFTALAAVLVGGLGPVLVVNMGEGDQGKGILMAALIFGVITAISLWVSAFGTKERVKIENSDTLKIKDMLPIVKMLLKDKAFTAFAIYDLLLFSIFSLKTAIAIYYVNGVLQNPEITGPFLLTLTVPMLPAMLLLSFIAHRFDKTKILKVFALITILGHIPLLFVENVTSILILNVITTVGVAGGLGLIYAYSAELVQHFHIKEKQYYGGIIMSFTNFIQKLSIALVGVIVGVGLTLANYTAGTVSQQSITVISFIFIVAPILLTIAGVVPMIKNYTVKKVQESGIEENKLNEESLVDS